jgi:hypothetical protein
MVGGEGDMVLRMPVLREHDIFKFLRHAVDRGHNLLAARYSQGAARAKVILNIHHDQGVLV